MPDPKPKHSHSRDPSKRFHHTDDDLDHLIIERAPGNEPTPPPAPEAPTKPLNG